MGWKKASYFGSSDPSARSRAMVGFEQAMLSCGTGMNPGSSPMHEAELRVSQWG